MCDRQPIGAGTVGRPSRSIWAEKQHGLMPQYKKMSKCLSSPRRWALFVFVLPATKWLVWTPATMQEDGETHSKASR